MRDLVVDGTSVNKHANIFTCSVKKSPSCRFLTLLKCIWKWWVVQLRPKRKKCNVEINREDLLKWYIGVRRMPLKVFLDNDEFLRNSSSSYNLHYASCSITRWGIWSHYDPLWDDSDVRWHYDPLWDGSDVLVRLEGAGLAATHWVTSDLLMPLLHMSDPCSQQLWAWQLST